MRLLTNISSKLAVFVLFIDREGVGRTGVFCSLSVLIERLKAEGVVDVFQTVKRLRSQRPAMVQTKDQYKFIYKALAQGTEELLATASEAKILQPTALVASVCCCMGYELNQPNHAHVIVFQTW